MGLQGVPLLLDLLWPEPAAGLAFQPASVVAPLQRGKLLRASEPGLRDRRLQHPDRVLMDRERHRERGCRPLPPSTNANRAGSGKRQGAPCTISATITSDRTLRASTPGSTAIRENSAARVAPPPKRAGPGAARGIGVAMSVELNTRAPARSIDADRPGTRRYRFYIGRSARVIIGRSARVIGSET